MADIKLFIQEREQDYGTDEAYRLVELIDGTARVVFLGKKWQCEDKALIEYTNHIIRLEREKATYYIMFDHHLESFEGDYTLSLYHIITNEEGKSNASKA